MNKLLFGIFWLVLLAAAFVAGRKYAETMAPRSNSVAFVTQSVDNSNNNFDVIEKGALKIYKSKDTNAREPLGKNTKMIPCPGVDAKQFLVEIDQVYPPKRLFDGETELSTYGFNLAMIATNQKTPITLYKAVKKSPVWNGQCIYVVNKDTILIYDIALDPSCIADWKVFTCNGG